MDSLYDLTLYAENREIKAHQTILGKVSPYFARTFKRFNSQGKLLVIPIADISYDGLYSVIMLIYTGQISADRRNSEEFKKAFILLDLEFELIVKTLDKKSFTFAVRPSDTVLLLKEKIREKMQLQAYGQRLLSGGTLLEDKNTLAFYNITLGSTLHVIHRMLCSSGSAPKKARL